MVGIENEQKKLGTIQLSLNSSALEHGYKFGLIYAICYFVLFILNAKVHIHTGMLLLFFVFNPIFFTAMIIIFKIVYILTLLNMIYYLVLMFIPTKNKVKIDKNFFKQNILKIISSVLFVVITIQVLTSFLLLSFSI